MASIRELSDKDEYKDLTSFVTTFTSKDKITLTKMLEHPFLSNALPTEYLRGLLRVCDESDRENL